jgi:hypothetical protein
VAVVAVWLPGTHGGEDAPAKFGHATVWSVELSAAAWHGIIGYRSWA